jgi:hypothetical protein
MKTKNLTELTDNLDLQSKLAILGIIDLKVESDMEKVMNKLDSMEHNIKSIKESVNFKLNTVMWVFGIGFTFLGIVITLLKIL